MCLHRVYQCCFGDVCSWICGLVSLFFYEMIVEEDGCGIVVVFPFLFFFCFCFCSSTFSRCDVCMWDGKRKMLMCTVVANVASVHGVLAMTNRCCKFSFCDPHFFV
eukprot:TRINITY_DN2611_c0_g1_i7.p3 TRINITY_DN2611_c0_g1~~TRINITY_DN2611_c0_g1_i7.p3  ORF type:complete len:106 (+),score=1.89 TRINITY_DN2611_c0_g1_i7:532-849(+)